MSKIKWIDGSEPEDMITEEWANKSYPNFYKLCQELVDDLDSWMEFDEQPSMLWQEYEKSINLIKKVRKALKESK